MCTITVVGAGYVGLSNAIILAQHNKVYAVDTIPEKVDLINAKNLLLQTKKTKSIFPISRLI